MKLAGLLPLIQQSTAYKRTLNRLWTPQGGDSAFSLRWPLLDAARPAILGALQQDWVGPLLVLTAQPERAHFLQEQVSVWSTRAHRGIFPPRTHCSTTVRPGMARRSTGGCPCFPLWPARTMLGRRFCSLLSGR